MCRRPGRQSAPGAGPGALELRQRGSEEIRGRAGAGRHLARRAVRNGEKTPPVTWGRFGICGNGERRASTRGPREGARACKGLSDRGRRWGSCPRRGPERMPLPSAAPLSRASQARGGAGGRAACAPPLRAPWPRGLGGPARDLQPPPGQSRARPQRADRKRGSSKREFEEMCVCACVREETSFGSSRKSSCDSSCHCPLLKVQYAAPGPIAGGGDGCNPPPWPSPGSRSAFRPGGQGGGFVVKAPASLVLTEVWGPLQLPSSEGSAFPRRWVAGGHVTCAQALRSPPSAPGAS